MREIKFRAWSVKNNCFSLAPIFMNMQGEVFDAGGDETHTYIIEQFTGLLDKNGKEIYEGDIVRVAIDHETRTSHTSPVGFGPDGALIHAHPAHIQMELKSVRSLSDYCGRYSNDCEVIGNIHENGDLLK